MWEGRGKFFCPGMEEFNGRTKVGKGESETAEGAEHQIKLDVLKKLRLSRDLVSCVTFPNGIHQSTSTKKTEVRRPTGKKAGRTPAPRVKG
jgi:hypothetical protein